MISGISKKIVFSYLFFFNFLQNSSSVEFKNFNRNINNKITQLSGSKILNNKFSSNFPNILLDNEFDVVFLDPPYEMARVSEVFLRLKELRVTKKNSLIIYESNKELVKVDKLEILKSRKTGRTHLSFLKFLN